MLSGVSLVLFAALWSVVSCQGPLGGLGDLLKGVGDAVGDAVGGATGRDNASCPQGKNCPGGLGDVLKDVLDKTGDAVGGLTGQGEEKCPPGKNCQSGLEDVLKDVLDKTGDAVGGLTGQGKGNCPPRETCQGGLEDLLKELLDKAGGALGGLTGQGKGNCPPGEKCQSGLEDLLKELLDKAGGALGGLTGQGNCPPGEKCPSGLEDLLKELLDKAGGALGGLTGQGSSLLGPLLGALDPVLGALGPVVGSLLGTVQGLLGLVLNLVSAVVALLLKILGLAGPDVSQVLGPLLSLLNSPGAQGAQGALVGTLLGYVKGLVSQILKQAGPDASSVLGPLTSLLDLLEKEAGKIAGGTGIHKPCSCPAGNGNPVTTTTAKPDEPVTTTGTANAEEPATTTANPEEPVTAATSDEPDSTGDPDIGPNGEVVCPGRYCLSDCLLTSCRVVCLVTGCTVNGVLVQGTFQDLLLEARKKGLGYAGTVTGLPDDDEGLFGGQLGQDMTRAGFNPGGFLGSFGRVPDPTNPYGQDNPGPPHKAKKQFKDTIEEGGDSAGFARTYQEPTTENDEHKGILEEGGDSAGFGSTYQEPTTENDEHKGIIEEGGDSAGFGSAYQEPTTEESVAEPTESSATATATNGERQPLTGCATPKAKSNNKKTSSNAQATATATGGTNGPAKAKQTPPGCPTPQQKKGDAKDSGDANKEVPPGCPTPRRKEIKRKDMKKRSPPSTDTKYEKLEGTRIDSMFGSTGNNGRTGLKNKPKTNEEKRADDGQTGTKTNRQNNIKMTSGKPKDNRQTENSVEKTQGLKGTVINERSQSGVGGSGIEDDGGKRRGSVLKKEKNRAVESERSRPVAKNVTQKRREEPTDSPQRAKNVKKPHVLKGTLIKEPLQSNKEDKGNRPEEAVPKRKRNRPRKNVMSEDTHEGTPVGKNIIQRPREVPTDSQQTANNAEKSRRLKGTVINKPLQSRPEDGRGATPKKLKKPPRENEGFEDTPPESKPTKPNKKTKEPTETKKEMKKSSGARKKTRKPTEAGKPAEREYDADRPSGTTNKRRPTDANDKPASDGDVVSSPKKVIDSKTRNGGQSGKRKNKAEKKKNNTLQENKKRKRPTGLKNGDDYGPPPDATSGTPKKKPSRKTRTNGDRTGPNKKLSKFTETPTSDTTGKSNGRPSKSDFDTPTKKRKNKLKADERPEESVDEKNDPTGTENYKNPDGTRTSDRPRMTKDKRNKKRVGLNDRERRNSDGQTASYRPNSPTEYSDVNNKEEDRLSGPDETTLEQVVTNRPNIPLLSIWPTGNVDHKVQQERCPRNYRLVANKCVPVA